MKVCVLFNNRLDIQMLGVYWFQFRYY